MEVERHDGSRGQRGEMEQVKGPENTEGTDSPVSAEYNSLPILLWPHVRAKRTPSTQSLTFPPVRAGRERQLSGRVRVTQSDMW